MTTSSRIGASAPPKPLGFLCHPPNVSFDILLFEIVEPRITLEVLGRLCLACRFYNVELRNRMQKFRSDDSPTSFSLALVHDNARRFLGSLCELRKLDLHCTQLGSTFPPNLVELTLRPGSVITDFSALPLSLSSLTIPIRPIHERSLRTLPKNLKSLNIVLRQVVEQELKQLPPSLERLDLECYTSKTTLSLITEVGAGYLPTTLRSLSLGRNITVSKTALSHLPSNLKTLILCCKLFKPTGQQNMMSPPYFPAGLHRLVIRVKPSPSARRREWPNMLTAQLPSGLRHLEFDDGPAPTSTILQSEELTFSSLPFQLESLVVSYRPIPSSLLQLLPQSFKRLVCSTRFTDDELACLASRGIEIGTI